MSLHPPMSRSSPLPISPQPSCGWRLGGAKRSAYHRSPRSLPLDDGHEATTPPWRTRTPAAWASRHCGACGNVRAAGDVRKGRALAAFRPAQVGMPGRPPDRPPQRRRNCGQRGLCALPDRYRHALRRAGPCHHSRRHLAALGDDGPCRHRRVVRQRRKLDPARAAQGRQDRHSRRLARSGDPALFLQRAWRYAGLCER